MMPGARTTNPPPAGKAAKVRPLSPQPPAPRTPRARRRGPQTEAADPGRVRQLTTACRRAERERDASVRRAAAIQEKLEKSLQEYQALNEALNAANEEYLTVNEELNAANEEYMTVNEELSAANEEIEASRTALQTVNAELNQINAQLKDRVDELTRAELEIRHQASFPLLNPNPVLEWDLAGDLIFCNQAARDTLQRLFLEDVGLFQPADFHQLLEHARGGAAESCWREVELGDRIFRECVQFVPSFQTVRIYASDVTEKRRAHQAVLESESRFRSVYEHSQDLIYRLNLQTGRYEYLSPAARALTGFEPGELMALSNEEVIGRVHPEELPALKAALADLAETGTVRVDYRFRGKDDRYAWWSNYLVVVKDENGLPLYRDGFVRDITEQKQAEAALRGSEEQYRTLFTGMSEGFALHEIICDERGEPCDYRFLDVNPAFERLTGLKREDVVGHRHNDVLPQDSPRWVQEYGRVALTGEPASFENYSPELKKHFSVFAYCPGPRLFAVVFVDATARHEAEAELRAARDEAERRAREAEEGKRRLDAMLEYIPEGITLVSAPDIVTQAISKYTLNLLADGWTEATGMSMEDWLAKVEHFQTDGITPAKVEDLPLWRAVKYGEISQGRELILRRPDGTLMPVSCNAGPIRDQEGRIIGAIVAWRDITERRQTEEALRQSEERYRRLVEQSPDAVFVNRHNRIEYANPAALDLFGAREPGQVLGKSPFERFHPKYHPIMRERIRRLTDGASVSLVPATIIRLDGELREAEVAASSFMDNEGPAIQVILHDVTDRKKKENELHRMNWILNALSDSSQSLMRAQEEDAYLEEVCRIVVEDCNHPMVWVGYAQEDEDKTVRAVANSGFNDGYLDTLNLTWADTERGRGPTGTAIRNGEAVVCRNMLTDPAFLPWREAALKRGYASSIALPLAFQGKVFGALTIYAREPEAFAPDEIKLLEKLADNLAYGIMAIRLKKAHEQAEEEFRTLAENSPDSITRLDPSMKHLYANSVARVILGEDITGKTWREGGFPPGFLAIWEAVFQRVLDTGKAETREDEIFSPREKQVKIYSCRILPEFGDGGEVRSVLIMRSDITELKKLTSNLEKMVSEKTEELIQAHHELEHARRMADVGRLASTVAHEMRNPLAAIRMAAYNIERKAGNPALSKHLQTISKKVIESDQIIQNLLNFSRIKSASYQRVDLGALLEECLGMLAEKYSGWAVRLEKDLGEADVVLEADPTQLGMLFTNLLDNAFQALPDNVGTIALSLKPQDAQGVLVTVKDNGAGIPEQYLSKIFDPFFTTRSKGTGLGLAVCREIVDLHHGKISLQSTPGQGTEFSVSLPRQQPLEPAVSAADGAEDVLPPV